MTVFRVLPNTAKYEYNPTKRGFSDANGRRLWQDQLPMVLCPREGVVSFPCLIVQRCHIPNRIPTYRHGKRSGRFIQWPLSKWRETQALEGLSEHLRPGSMILGGGYAPPRRELSAREPFLSLVTFPGSDLYINAAALAAMRATGIGFACEQLQDADGNAIPYFAVAPPFDVIPLPTSVPMKRCAECGYRDQLLSRSLGAQACAEICAEMARRGTHYSFLEEYGAVCDEYARVVLLSIFGDRIACSPLV
jgi:hypothetical protein